MANTFSARESGIPIADLSVLTKEFPPLFDVVSTPLYGELQQAVSEVRPGTIAIDTTWLPNVTTDVQEAELIEIAGFGRTRRASKHAVMFGQMLLHGETGGESSMHIAVKVLDDSVLAHEYGVTKHIRAGNIALCDTFEPIGIARMYDGQAAMVSQYRHSVRSSDNIFRNPELLHDKPVIDEALVRAGFVLATPHAAGWIQVDTQEKNIMHDAAAQDSGRVFIADLEETRPINDDPAERRKQLKLNDIRTFIASTYVLERLNMQLPKDHKTRLVSNVAEAYSERQAMLGTDDTLVSIDEIAAIVAADERLPYYNIG